MWLHAAEALLADTLGHTAHLCAVVGCCTQPDDASTQMPYLWPYGNGHPQATPQWSVVSSPHVWPPCTVISMLPHTVLHARMHTIASKPSRGGGGGGDAGTGGADAGAWPAASRRPAKPVSVRWWSASGAFVRWGAAHGAQGPPGAPHIFCPLAPSACVAVWLCDLAPRPPPLLLLVLLLWGSRRLCVAVQPLSCRQQSTAHIARRRAARSPLPQLVWITVTRPPHSLTSRMQASTSSPSLRGSQRLAGHAQRVIVITPVRSSGAHAR